MDDYARCAGCDMIGDCVCCSQWEGSVTMLDDQYYDDNNNPYYSPAHMEQLEREEQEHNTREKIANKVNYAGWLEGWLIDEYSCGPLHDDIDLAVSSVNDALNTIASKLVDDSELITLPVKLKVEIDALIDSAEHTENSKSIISDMRELYISELNQSS